MNRREVTRPRIACGSSPMRSASGRTSSRAGPGSMTGCPAGRSISHSTSSTATRVPQLVGPSTVTGSTLERPTKVPTNRFAGAA